MNSFDPIIGGLPFVPLCGGFVISLLIAIWVASDAQKRGMNPLLWGLLTWLFCIPVLPIYLIMRKPVGSPPDSTMSPRPPASYPPPASGGFCPKCGAAVPAGSKFCPVCGSSV